MTAAETGGEGRAPAPADLVDDPEAEAMALIGLLADEVGPRRPTSRNEGLAALLLRDRLRRRGLDAEVERFQGYASFGYPFAIIQAAALLPELLPPRRRLARSAIALASGASSGERGEPALRRRCHGRSPGAAAATSSRRSTPPAAPSGRFA